VGDKKNAFRFWLESLKEGTLESYRRKWEDSIKTDGIGGINLAQDMDRYDHLCDLVVRVLGYRSRGPRYDSRSYQIF
jgi:hypothetical protein